MRAIFRHSSWCRAVLKPTALAVCLVLASVAGFSRPSQQNETKPAAPALKPSEGKAQDPKKRDDDMPVVRANANLVVVSVTVTDPQGRFVTGLEKEHFEVFDDKVLQKTEFFSDEDAPISVGVIFDISGSMRGRINRSQQALRKFLDTCHEEDEYFLVGFNSNARLIQDFTPNGERIADSLMLAETKGQTALYDAAYIGVEKVRQGRHSRKALLVISDGQDNNSRYSYRELRQLVKETDVQLYAIGITNIFSTNSLDMQGQTILEELSRLTGGRAFFPNNDVEMQEVITRIGLELRHQYSIGYTPTTAAGDGQWHKIKVKVNPPKGLPKLNVRAKEGYYGTVAN